MVWEKVSKTEFQNLKHGCILFLIKCFAWKVLVLVSIYLFIYLNEPFLEKKPQNYI